VIFLHCLSGNFNSLLLHLLRLLNEISNAS
jgi:hypothetical protein